MITFYPRPAVVGELPLRGHAVIEASAGTGKTYTIEHLVVDRLLRTDASLDQVLVVTFTEKATAELRKRIRALMEAVLFKGVGVVDDPAGHWRIDEAARTKLKAAIFGFDRAPIYTIHGFCHRLLTDLAFDSGQLFEQDFVDTARAFNRAWRRALREDFAVHPAPSAVLRTWLGSGRDEASLEWLLLAAYRQRYLESARPLDAELPALMDAFARGLDRGAIITDYAGTALQTSALDKAREVLGKVIEVVGEGAADGSPEDRLGQLMALDLDALVSPHRVATHKKRRFPDELAPETLVFLDRVERLRLLAALAGSLERTAVESFLPTVVERLERHKRVERQLDFDDLLDRVWDALQGPRGEALAGTLRDRYRYGLIDEFQDTDPRQWGIFRRIFVEGHEARPGPRGLTIIGDPKQAIYGFRGADVHTYLAARAELLTAHATRAPLDMNYRSTDAMIRAVNRVLDQDGKQPVFSGVIRYDEPVRCGRPELVLKDVRGDEAPAVVLWHYKPPPPQGGRNRTTLPRYQLRDAFTHQLAQSLRALLFESEHQLWVHEGNEHRVVKAKDVFVLVRTRREEREVGAALRAAGVPYAFFKQEGLFQSDEARDIHDVLAAVVDPTDGSRRLRAYATPFFGVPWGQLDRYRHLPSRHPMVMRLFDWHRLAEEEQYAALYHRMLHDSGLVARELFLSESERELTNYQHVFELLLEVAARRRLSPEETVTLLDRYIRRVEAPEGADGNIQRLPDERDAVQIMTVHKSKGLEADVVAVYGGFGEHPAQTVSVLHDSQGVRQVFVGEAARETAGARLAAESAAEDQRLLYVAITRARARLYLPFPDSSRAVPGSYAPLKSRLRAMSEEGFGGDFVSVATADRPRWVRDAPRPAPPTRAPIERWRPPAGVLGEGPQLAHFERLLATRAPLLITSYTRLKDEGGAGVADGAGQGSAGEASLEAEEFKRDEPVLPPVAARAALALPGGRHMGRCLHEAIETLDFMGFGRAFDEWRADPAVTEVFEWAFRRHDIDPRWQALAQRAVYDTLTASIPLGAAGTVAALYPCRHLVELEFLYPIPEVTHPLLGQAIDQADGDGRWAVDRGFVKGFIDLVFVHEGRTYFADWKSDVLPSYRSADIAPYVDAHYGLQAQLYALGVVRWLGIRDEADYEARFGGSLYVFLRGMSEREAVDDGVYFERPSWADVIGYEDMLRTLVPPRAEGV